MQLAVDRGNLGAALAAALRTLILDGDLAAGQRLNEVHLAARLGVSRTPLREALTRLASEGTVTSVPRLGFFVCALSADEYEHLHPIRAILDPAALRQGGLPPPERIERLKAINHRLIATKDPLEAVRLDEQWHLELLAGCTNPVLLGLIEQMMWRTRRYELGLMRERQNLERSGEDHERIARFLEEGDLERACAALTSNMQGGEQPVLNWLRERETRQ